MASAGGHWTKISQGEKAGTRVFVPKGIDDGFPIFVMQTFNKPYMQYLNEQKKAGALVNPQELPKGAKPAPKTPKEAGPDLFNQKAGPAPKKYGPGDLEAEKAKLFIPTGPQSSKLAPGVTSQQAKAYYAKVNTYQAAKLFKYKDGKSAAEHVESLLNEGYTIWKPKVASVLLLDSNGHSVLLRHKPAIDYAKMLLQLSGDL